MTAQRRTTGTRATRRGRALVLLGGVAMCVWALLATLTPPVAEASTTYRYDWTATALDPGTFERYVVDRHNQARAAAGLGPLRVHAQLTHDARAWSQSMAARGVLQHQSPSNGYESYASSCTATGTWLKCAENISVGPDPELAHTSWMDSNGHRDNIMNPGHDLIGIGVWIGPDCRIWWTARLMTSVDVAGLPAGPHPQADSPRWGAGADGCFETESAPAARTATRTERFVEAAYQLFTGRGATAAELAGWRQQLDAGTDRRAFIGALATSDDWLGNEVDKIYRLALDRGTDPQGRSYWAQTVRDGRRITELVVFVFSSDEFYQRAGGTPAGFVQRVHRKVHGRDATVAELSTWTARMAAGMSRGEVADRVYASIESRLRRVDRMYAEMLARGADAGGRAYWAEQLLAVDDVRLAIFLAGSDEFFNRA